MPPQRCHTQGTRAAGHSARRRQTTQALSTYATRAYKGDLKPQNVEGQAILVNFVPAGFYEFAAPEFLKMGCRCLSLYGSATRARGSCNTAGKDAWIHPLVWQEGKTPHLVHRCGAKVHRSGHLLKKCSSCGSVLATQELLHHCYEIAHIVLQRRLFLSSTTKQAFKSHPFANRRAHASSF
jgi:hypothetical protein